MKKSIFLILFVSLLFGCSSNNEKKAFFKTNICFESASALTEFVEFNDFSSTEVTVKQNGACLEIYSSSSKEISQIKSIVNSEHPNLEVEVKTYYTQETENQKREDLFSIPSISFPNIFDVFNRLLPLVKKSNQ